MPFVAKTFELVILDGTCQFEWQTPFVLLLSQANQGLKAVEDGGAVFLKLMELAGTVGARILFLFDALSNSLRTILPNICHGSRKAFYVVAKGIRRGPMLDR